MKIYWIILALLSVATVAGAQQRPPTLQIGLVKVRLGMPRNELQKEIAGTAEGDTVVHHTGDELGLNVLVITENLWSIGTPGGDHAGEIRFRNDRVVYAEREWLLKDSDAVDAILAAIYSFQQEGLLTCQISHDTIPPEPGVSHERAWIDCGARRLCIIKSKIKGQEFKSIIESIGSL